MTHVHTSDWGLFSQFLPHDLDRLAKETGAVSRWRKVRSGEDLLRLCLTYTVRNFSLRTTVAWAAMSDWIDMKDTSLLERLRKAHPFLEAILGHLVSQALQGPQAEGSTLRIVDATTVMVPGSKGAGWRVHATYDPVSRRLVGVQLTDPKGAERLERGQFSRGDLVVGDAGLSRASDIHAAHDRGAYSLLRIHPYQIRLLDRQGERVQVEPLLDRADAGQWTTEVLVPHAGQDPVPARLVVMPMPAGQAERARKRARRRSTKNGRTPNELSVRLAGYLCLLTTVPKELATPQALASYYRVRWQIELFFKRCKSLLNLSQLRADDPDLVRTYMTTKLIEVALLQLLTAYQHGAFSPSDVARA